MSVLKKTIMNLEVGFATCDDKEKKESRALLQVLWSVLPEFERMEAKIAELEKKLKKLDELKKAIKNEHEVYAHPMSTEEDCLLACDRTHDALNATED